MIFKMGHLDMYSVELSRQALPRNNKSSSGLRRYRFQEEPEQD